MISRHVEILNAVFTPMHSDGAVNFDRVPDMFDQFLGTGSQGVFLNGTTGECMSLSTFERLQLVEAWVACRQTSKRDDIKIIVHVGCCNLIEAAEMAKHAQDQGADGIAMVAAFYFKPKSLEDLVDQCAFVAAAAPEIPYYYYNIPSLTGVNFPLLDFLELAIRTIPNFGGLKNSFSDVVDYQHALHVAGKKYALYWGTDEAFMMLYTAGNRHYVGSTYNYMSTYYGRMLRAQHAGDLEAVTTLQGEADSIYRILTAHHGIIAGKEIMRLTGVDCGPVRRPLQQLSRADGDLIVKKLKDTTFFQYAMKKSKTATML